MSNNDIENFLLDFSKELFLYSNYSLYNSRDKIEFKPEVTNKKEEKKVIISTTIFKTDNTPLICSQQQLERPVA